jgi:hypothetical protein
VTWRTRSEVATGDDERGEGSSSRDNNSKRVPKAVEAHVAADAGLRMEVGPSTREEEGDGESDHEYERPTPHPSMVLGSVDADEEQRHGIQRDLMMPQYPASNGAVFRSLVGS